MTESIEVNRITESYYDSDDANHFYFQIWGGEDIHVGIYQSDHEDIAVASRRSVQKMMDLIAEPLSNGAKLLDIGAGFGGSARQIAQQFDAPVTCLNISQAQNKINEEINRKKNLTQQIEVKHGNFEELPFDNESFDIVWCQDSILHSSRRERVLSEVYRVLKPNGQFVFTDPMQDKDASSEALEPVLNRIHLDSLATPESYLATAKKLGFSEFEFTDLSEQLSNHYQRVLEELESRQNNPDLNCSRDYIERMKLGLNHWVNAGRKGLLRWGIFHFKKS